jgi:2-polyprenyl-3-methyl-5-hydroxy-6-metoxy-1,4-benzoquinol methylase
MATTTFGSRKSADPTYWMTQDQLESERLIQQSRLFNPLTQWVLLAAGISEGMKVLDVGSGSGDVAILAANLVGPSGKVIGVDSNAQVLETARTRAGMTGMNNVDFVHGDCRSLDLGSDFDAITGRLVLFYVADPAATIRGLTGYLKPGGVVLFQETNVTPESVRSIPSLPIWEETGRWAQAAATQAKLDLNMGFSLRRVFLDAGLPEPQMQLDSNVGGGPDWEGYSYLANTIRSMQPLIYESGIATPEMVDIDTLAYRLRSNTVAANAVAKAPDLVSAWSRKS